MDDNKIEEDRKIDSLFNGEAPEKKVVITKTFTFEQIGKFLKKLFGGK